MEWKYVGKRKNLFGKWCYPGDVVENRVKPPGNWISLGGGVEKFESIEEKVGVVEESVGVEELRKSLMKKKMAELRRIGYDYDARDTKKSELVEEIIKEKIHRGEL